MGRLNRIFLALFMLVSVGCGVKGRPLPPLNPAPIGRGEPTYKDSSKQKNVKKYRPIAEEEEEENSSESESP